MLGATLRSIVMRGGPSLLQSLQPTRQTFEICGSTLSGIHDQDDWVVVTTPKAVGLKMYIHYHSKTASRRVGGMSFVVYDASTFSLLHC